MKKLILPVGDTWEDIDNIAAIIEDWEKRTGKRLPDDYRAFMLKYNGGRPFPLMFKYQVPLDIYPSDEPVTFLDPLYKWSQVEEIWDRKVFNLATPSDMLFIGADPGGLELLISLRDEDYGKVFTWLHNLDAWGEGENMKLWSQANSFREFMDSLFENEAMDGENYWRLPGQESLEKELKF